MRLKSNFDSAGQFHGFSVWAGHWTTAADYKSVVLARRRALDDKQADPLQVRMIKTKNYLGPDRRKA